MKDLESFAYSVVRLECENSDGSKSTGTGFFFAIHEKNGKHVPLLVTNKHVIENSRKVTFLLTKKNTDDEPIFSDYQNITVNGRSHWKDHPDKNIDLSAFAMGPVFSKFKDDLKTEIKWSRITSANLPSSDQLRGITPISNVMMIGYPIGIWDQRNNRPIFRHGVTATDPWLPYNGKMEFVIDIAAFPGSSGSPVFLYEEGFNVVGSSGEIMGGRKGKLFFIGVLYGGMMYNSKGEIKVEEIPTKINSEVVLRIPTNLGLVLSSSLLRRFEDVFPDGE